MKAGILRCPRSLRKAEPIRRSLVGDHVGDPVPVKVETLVPAAVGWAMRVWEPEVGRESGELSVAMKPCARKNVGTKYRFALLLRRCMRAQGSSMRKPALFVPNVAQKLQLMHEHSGLHSRAWLLFQPRSSSCVQSERCWQPASIEAVNPRAPDPLK